MSVSKEIITELPTRQSFMDLLKVNPGLIIIKFGATWCVPCKKIKPALNTFFASSPPDVVCVEIDVDECFDLYAFLKSKRMINGIPAILCYKKDNLTFVPDDSVTGIDDKELKLFFQRCNLLLLSTKK